MEQVENERAAKTVKSELWEWAKALVIAAVLVFLIRYFIFSPFIVEGPSMEPNFHTGERLIVNKLIYDIRKPQRGEVIVFHAPNQDKDYIKRVIALPGERVKIENNKVYINGEELQEPYIADVVEQWARENRIYNRDFAETVVPENTVFVMGDNRVNSQDSRSIGSIEYSSIVGRADIIFWPFGSIGMVKHK